MAIGAKFVDVIPSSVENAIEVKKRGCKDLSIRRYSYERVYRQET